MDQTEQDAVANGTASSLVAFLDSLRECREAVLKPIAAALDSATVDALLNDSMPEVDELATHFSAEDLEVESVEVSAIGADKITYEARGSVEIALQWGSNSDVRRDDGAESSQYFPFYCEFQVPLDDPWDLGRAKITCGVDVSRWHEMMAPDESGE